MNEPSAVPDEEIAVAIRSAIESEITRVRDPDGDHDGDLSDGSGLRPAPRCGQWGGPAYPWYNREAWRWFELRSIALSSCEASHCVPAWCWSTSPGSNLEAQRSPIWSPSIWPGRGPTEPT